VAHIDNLVERIADPTLRAQVAEEVAKLAERKDFGLVFERHLPEDLEVPGVRPRRGDVVRMRRDEAKRNHLVLSTRQGEASILAVDASKRAVEGSEPEQRSLEELVVVKDFNVPIYPGLELIHEIVQDTERPVHLVIEGENYYVLETLLYTHERKVDVIYIDPPYNTGTDDWIYNDRFVSSTDSYRHSKWLSFMERRLIHARRLLTDTGVIIVAIGDDEHHRIRMLMDQIFGDENFIANVTWQGSGKNDARYTAGGVDYMLIYARNESRLRELDVRWKEPKPGLNDALAAGAHAWEESGHDRELATRLYRQVLRGLREVLEPAVFRYDQIDGQGRIFQADNMTSPNFRANLVFEVIHPTTNRPVPTPQNGWRYSREAMAELLGADKVIFGGDETTTPRLKRFLEEQGERVPYATFTQSRMPGSKRVETILGDRRFPNPKDHEVIMRWLAAISPKDGVILDFFGGSGTTAEAVMKLNDGDGGTRQSILVTNNELGADTAARLRRDGHVPGEPEWEAEGVFHRVTRPRIETVVSGERPDGSTYSEGIAENVAFYKLTFEDESLVALGRKFEAIAPLLWMKSGSIGPVVGRAGDEPWSLPDDATYGILFRTSQAKDFSDALASRHDSVRHIFIVSDSESAFQAALEYLPTEVRLGTTRLYSDYLHSFEINGKG
jgi:adenine-specific DNA-methyltransferase